MTKRGILAAGVLLVLALPEGSRAEGLAIDHKEVKCIIAGKYTRMTACFDPKPNLARGRVYFRATGTQPWYFVEFKPDAPCYNTFLPKARKDIKQVDYYVEGYATDSTSTRSADFGPFVVPREEDCKDRPVAPWVNKATVVVGAAAGGPAVPFGFVTAAGVGSTAVIGGLAAASVVGGAAALASRSDNANPPPTLAPGPSVNPTPPTTPAPPRTACDGSAPTSPRNRGAGSPSRRWAA